MKYSNAKHNVEVRFIEQNQKLNVFVESYGPYCPKEEIPLLFDKNYRGNTAKKVTSEGTGIGLYLVKKICDQHGIQIDIETEYIKKSNGLPYGKFIVVLQF